MSFKKNKIFFLLLFIKVIYGLRDPFEYVNNISALEFISSGYINNQEIAVVKIYDEFKTVKIGYLFNDYELIKINKDHIVFASKDKKLLKIKSPST